MIKSRRMRWVRHVTHNVVIRKVYNILGRKPDVKKTLGRPTYRLILRK
jgi:hypothetical protein